MAIQDTVKSWPWYGQAALFVVIGAVLFYLGHWQLIEPINKKILDLNNERESLIQEINRGETAKARAIEFEAELKRLEHQLESLKKILPETEEVADLYSRIQQEGTELGLTITMFRPDKHTPKEYYEEWPINVSLSGNYHILAKFFERIGKLYRIINVRDIRIRAYTNPKSTNTLTADCIATTFIYKEATPAPPPKRRGART
jgi:type IV pilus assembly protein PilO